MSSPRSRPEVSVVVPTHNRPASLLRLLHALRDGGFASHRFEVVIVADGCSDNTADLVRFEPLPFPVRVLEQNPGRGAAASRNLGASNARGDLLVFLDDDIEPGHALLAEHHAAHAGSGGPAVVIGPPLPLRPAGADLGTIAAWNWWEGQFSRMQRPGHRFSYDEVFSGNFSMPAALFREVGGFDVEFNNCRDDSELGLRLIQRGARVLFVPAAAGWHHELRDHPRLILRKRAEGKADVRLARLHPELWSTLRISWREMPLWHPLGLVRRLALSAPPLADLLIRGLTRCLVPLEALRLRGTWRKVQAGVMYGWYWRGVGEAVGGRKGLESLYRDCEARTPVPPPPLVIDLADGIDEAERRLEAERPSSASVRYGAIGIGTVPHRPGSEQLRGVHLRSILANDLRQSVLAALTTARATGQPRTLRLRAGTRPDELPAVSVIIPAWNAAATIRETLGSLTAQTHQSWEALVIDDGSTDETRDLVQRFAARDSRFRMLEQAHEGPAAARNTGLAAARHPWILYLDADDWLPPAALEQLATATTRGEVDAIHGGWARVTLSGVVQDNEFAPALPDLFPLFADYCAFAIGCCLFRRELIDRIGRFDPALLTCEDWDFWQRLTRSGARFVRIDEPVNHYRMRLRSGATATERLLQDGLLVIERGHSPDPRVGSARHPVGAPRDELGAARFRFAAWVAGILIGRSESPSQVLDEFHKDSAPDLNPHDIAFNLYRTVPLALACGEEAWDQLWPRVYQHLGSFLDSLERRSGAWRLKGRVMLALEQLTLNASELDRPFTRGATHAVEVEVTSPIMAVATSPETERVHCRVLVNGAPLGTVLLPCSDGVVSARVIADAVASTFAWPILRRFFQATRYGELHLVREPDGVVPCLNGVPLGPAVSDRDIVDAGQLHDHIGWLLFLQEFWGQPGVTAEAFYRDADPGAVEPGDPAIAPHFVAEISRQLTSIPCDRSTADIEVRVGGVAIGQVVVPAEGGLISPSRLRAIITMQAGLELARVVVREAILGRPFSAESIRVRLAERAERPRPPRIEITGDDTLSTFIEKPGA